MHDYTAWQVHEDRMREFTREADASRLAAMPRKGKRGKARALLRRWVRSAWPTLSVGTWRSPTPEHRRTP